MTHSFQQTASIFSVMTQMANQYGAINLAQGFPNFEVDPVLKNITSDWAQKEIHQYLPMAGYAPLLEKLAQLTQTSYGRKINPATDILITAGATQGIFTAIQALVQKDQQVIVLDPSYDCYPTPILLRNAEPVRVNLNDDFTPDWKAIAAATNSKTRMIIINNPHNPSGRIWSEDDFLELEKLLELYPNLIVLSDEVYEYITFEKPHISVHQRPKLYPRCVSVSSFGKSFHITGWKIGYLIAPEPLMNEIKKVHQFLVFSVNSLAQYAINDYLNQVKMADLGKFYQQKRDLFRELLQPTNFELLPCEGSYFQTVSYKKISEENDLEFTRRLVQDYGVAAIPLSPFYADNKQTGCIRFCFAKEENTLTEAAERLRKL
ncbi:aminotransferase class I/II-fold pyridoxal phosphate-dependent enzyme [Flavobacterium sp. CYK-4]|uniref:methionine aminotransferase n=1 Tax=Flavobacterium lotistagni TaxID=2709660 RepID=UPI0014078269|nr:methionine aminotransferase [Flavobacterium lotistagni]NHM06156.1 aminotransferase class I/II-fold pyridoxal phosphate-dependent enzyme [Flavobacterium lotistagni]